MKAAALWFWYLVPGNPVFLRILYGGSRRMRDLFTRMGYLSVLMGALLIGLLASGGAAGQLNLTDLAKAGTRIFAMVSYVQVVAVCLLAPLFMAGAIRREQAGETMDILLTTPLTNLQIVLGTLMGRLFFVLALLLSGLPLFAVLLIFGGVPVRSVFVAFSVAGLVAITVGSVAILLAVLRKGGRKAVFAFVFCIVGYLLVVGAADSALRMWQRGGAAPPSAGGPAVESPQPPPSPFGQGFEEPDLAMDQTVDPLIEAEAEAAGQTRGTGAQTTILTPLHPILVLESYLDTANYRPPTPEELSGAGPVWRFYRGNPLGAFSLLSVLICLGLVLFSALELRRIGQGRAIIPLPTGLRRMLRLRGAGERRRPPRTIWVNPIAWRESNTRGKLAGAILGRWGFVVMGLLFALLLTWMYDSGKLPTIIGPNGSPLPDVQVFHRFLSQLLWLEIVIITLVALYMSAGSVSKEREDGTLDLMLTTPITPRQYVWGKVRGLVVYLMLLVAVPVLTLAIVAVYSIAGGILGWQGATVPMSALYPGANAAVNVPLMIPEAPVVYFFMLLPFVAFSVWIGMHLSVNRKTVLGAVTIAIVFVGGAVALATFCGAPAAGNIPVIGPVLNSFSPITNFTMLLNPYGTVHDYAANELASRASFIIGALSAAGLYTLCVYLGLTTIVKNFDHTVRRLSGTG